MECSQLFTLCHLADYQALLKNQTSVEAGAILSIIGDDSPFSDSALVEKTIDDSIQFAFEVVRSMFEMDKK